MRWFALSIEVNEEEEEDSLISCQLTSIQLKRRIQSVAIGSLGSFTRGHTGEPLFVLSEKFAQYYGVKVASTQHQQQQGEERERCLIPW